MRVQLGEQKTPGGSCGVVFVSAYRRRDTAVAVPVQCLWLPWGDAGWGLGGVIFSFAIAFSLFLLVKIKFYSE